MKRHAALASGPEIIPLLVADVFQLAGGFRRLGERIAQRTGHTQSQWQVLSVISAGPHTVAQIARRLGYARQSIQRTADQLVDDGLAGYEPNPDHKKSPLLAITKAGAEILQQITKEAKKWHLQLASRINQGELATTSRVLRQLCAMTDSRDSPKPVR